MYVRWSTDQYFGENAFLFSFIADDRLVRLNVTEQVSWLNWISCQHCSQVFNTAKGNR